MRGTVRRKDRRLRLEVRFHIDRSNEDASRANLQQKSRLYDPDNLCGSFGTLLNMRFDYEALQSENTELGVNIMP